MLLVLGLTPLKKLYGNNQTKTQDTTLTPGIHDGYAVADHSVQPPPSVRIGLYDVCSCVSFVRWATGIQFPSISYARNMPINDRIPQVGGIVVLNDSVAGHLAEVVKIDVDNLTIKEANYYQCATDTRIIPLTAPDIVGFYNP